MAQKDNSKQWSEDPEPSSSSDSQSPPNTNVPVKRTTVIEFQEATSSSHPVTVDNPQPSRSTQSVTEENQPYRLHYNRSQPAEDCPVLEISDSRLSIITTEYDQNPIVTVSETGSNNRSSPLLERQLLSNNRQELTYDHQHRQAVEVQRPISNVQSTAVNRPDLNPARINQQSSFSGNQDAINEMWRLYHSYQSVNNRPTLNQNLSNNVKETADQSQLNAGGSMLNERQRQQSGSIKEQVSDNQNNLRDQQEIPRPWGMSSSVGSATVNEQQKQSQQTPNIENLPLTKNRSNETHTTRPNQINSQNQPAVTSQSESCNSDRTTHEQPADDESIIGRELAAYFRKAAVSHRQAKSVSPLIYRAPITDKRKKGSHSRQEAAGQNRQITNRQASLINDLINNYEMDTSNRQEIIRIGQPSTSSQTDDPSAVQPQIVIGRELASYFRQVARERQTSNNEITNEERQAFDLARSALTKLQSINAGRQASHSRQEADQKQSNISCQSTDEPTDGKYHIVTGRDLAAQLREIVYSRMVPCDNSPTKSEQQLQSNISRAKIADQQEPNVTQKTPVKQEPTDKNKEASNNRQEVVAQKRSSGDSQGSLSIESTVIKQQRLSDNSELTQPSCSRVSTNNETTEVQPQLPPFNRQNIAGPSRSSTNLISKQLAHPSCSRITANQEITEVQQQLPPFNQQNIAGPNRSSSNLTISKQLIQSSCSRKTANQEITEVQQQLPPNNRQNIAGPSRSRSSLTICKQFTQPSCSPITANQETREVQQQLSPNNRQNIAGPSRSSGSFTISKQFTQPSCSRVTVNQEAREVQQQLPPICRQNIAGLSRSSMGLTISKQLTQPSCSRVTANQETTEVQQQLPPFNRLNIVSPSRSSSGLTISKQLTQQSCNRATANNETTEMQQQLPSFNRLEIAGPSRSNSSLTISEQQQPLDLHKVVTQKQSIDKSQESIIKQRRSNIDNEVASISRQRVVQQRQSINVERQSSTSLNRGAVRNQTAQSIITNQHNLNIQAPSFLNLVEEEQSASQPVVDGQQHPSCSGSRTANTPSTGSNDDCYNPSNQQPKSSSKRK